MWCWWLRLGFWCWYLVLTVSRISFATIYCTSAWCRIWILSVVNIKLLLYLMMIIVLLLLFGCYIWKVCWMYEFEVMMVLSSRVKRADVGSIYRLRFGRACIILFWLSVCNVCLWVLRLNWMNKWRSFVLRGVWLRLIDWSRELMSIWFCCESLVGV